MAVDHLYTWTFSRKSLLIRYYLWLYEADENTVNFCKLFWGMICTPVTLPLRLLISLVVAVAKTIRFGGRGVGFGLVGIATALGWVMRKIVASWPIQATDRMLSRMSTVRSERKQAKRDAARAAFKIKWLAFLDELALTNEWKANYYKTTVWNSAEQASYMREWEYDKLMKAKCEAARVAPEKPVEPSVPSRFVTLVANGTDRVVAFFQAHPAIGETSGKIFVRGVFYPFLVLAPIAAFVFMGDQSYHHYNGLLVPFVGVWWLLYHIGDGIWWGFREISDGFMHAGHFGKWLLHWVVKVLVFTLASIAAFAVIGGFMWLTFGACMRWEYYMDRRYALEHGVDLSSQERAPQRPQGDKLERILYKWTSYIDPRDDDGNLKFSASDRFNWALGKGKRTAQVAGTGIAAPAKIVTRRVAPRVRHSAVHSGRGIKGMGQFLVMGHHAVKGRTCPRIRIVDDANANA